MSEITSILIPYDFSEAAKKGFRYAVDFAGNRPEMHLRLCFIAEKATEEYLSEAFENLSGELGKTFRAKISWTSLIPGSVEGLLEKSREEDPDMILMGTSGSRDPEVPTKTAEIVMKAKCPVLVVPLEAPDEFSLSKIALMLGPNEIDDPSLLGNLLEICRKYKSRVTVLTIQHQPGPMGYSEEEERNEHLLKYYLESFYSHHDYIRHEDVVEAVFAYVAQHEIEMIAVLPRRHSRKGTESEGRLTRLLTLQSKTPLLALEH